jgi:hypothetical protein
LAGSEAVFRPYDKQLNLDATGEFPLQCSTAMKNCPVSDRKTVTGNTFRGIRCLTQ